MTAPPSPPARESPRQVSHASQPLPPSSVAAVAAAAAAAQHPPQPPPPPPPPPPQQQQQHHHPYPVSFNYPPPSTLPSSQPSPIPPQSFLPHLTYMEGQFATQALLVEQQRRIKHLEAELASTQLEVMRLRSQVHHVHSDPAAVSIHSVHPIIGVPHVPHTIPDSATVPHGASVAAAAHAAAAAAAMPQSTPMSQPQPTHQNPPPQPPPPPPTARTLPQSHTQQTPPQQQEEPKKASSRYWTPDEHKRFLEGLELFGQKDIKAISRHVGTRSATQVRTHAQKYYLRIERERMKAEAEGKGIQNSPATSAERRIINGKHATSTAKNGTAAGAAQKATGAKAALNNTPMASSPGVASARNAANGNRVIVSAKSENGGEGVVEKDKKGDITKQLSAATQGEKVGGGRNGQNGSTPPLKENEKRGARVRGTSSSRSVDAQAGLLSNAHDMNGASAAAGNIIASQSLASGALAQPQSLAEIPEVSRPYAPDHFTISQGTTTLLPSSAAAIQLGQAQPHSSTVKIESSQHDAVDPDQHQASDCMDIASQGPLSQTAKIDPTVRKEAMPQCARPSDDGQEDTAVSQQPANELSNHGSIKEEPGVAGEREQELGKRAAVPLTKKSPKKRMKKPSAVSPLPSAPASTVAVPSSSAAISPANLPRPASFSGLNGPGSKSIEQKMYSLGEGGGSMSNLRALLRVPNEDQVAGASGSKPPTLRRNESSNSVLADLSKSVGVLSRSNSFVSPSGKGVTRSNSILSLLSGIPTALRESPSTERLLGLDSGEDRVMATLKTMDTTGVGPSASGGGPSPGGPTTLGNMGDRSLSFGQLQHMGLDDLEDPSAVALALQDEQKWGDG